MTSDFLNSLIGTWNLISYTAASVTDPSDILLPLGACRGRAIFSLDGYVSAYIQATNIQPYSEGRFHASTEELANAAKRTIAYTAPYRLEEDKAQSSKATIYYDVEMSMPPNWIGTTEIRVLELEKGEDGGIYNLANDDVLEFADYFNIACQEYGLTVIPGIPVHIPGSAWFRAFGPLATRPEPIHLLNRTGERLWERLRKRYDLVDALHPRMDLAAAHHAAGDLVLDTTKAREAGFETIFPDYRSAIRDVLERYQKVRWIP